MSVFVKICGITSEEDALLAVAMGADALGFVFAPSPRQVQPPLVADIIKRVPPEILTVGVFRDEVPQRMSEIVHATGLRGAQLHGHESPAVTRGMAAHVQFVVKAFAASDPEIERAGVYGADAILMDHPDPGTGQLFDWSLSDRAPRQVRLLLAGGLTPANVAGAVAAVDPWGVDVSSGVESEPGHKDAIKLRAFVLAAKGARPPVEPRAGLGDEDAPYDWQRASS